MGAGHHGQGLRVADGDLGPEVGQTGGDVQGGGVAHVVAQGLEGRPQDGDGPAGQVAAHVGAGQLDDPVALLAVDGVDPAQQIRQVRGPVQFGFARSIDPIVPQEISIARTAITKVTDFYTKRATIGRKFIVPYALYKVEGYVSANLARKTTGFSEEDLALLWQAILRMFELDRSAARGNMATRELIVFRHESELGNAPSYKLFERIHVKKKAADEPARSYQDYEVTVDEADLPEGVTCTRMS